MESGVRRGHGGNGPTTCYSCRSSGGVRAGDAYRGTGRSLLGHGRFPTMGPPPYEICIFYMNCRRITRAARTSHSKMHMCDKLLAASEAGVCVIAGRSAVGTTRVVYEAGSQRTHRDTQKRGHLRVEHRTTSPAEEGQGQLAPPTCGPLDASPCSCSAKRLEPDSHLLRTITSRFIDLTWLSLSCCKDKAERPRRAQISRRGWRHVIVSP